MKFGEKLREHRKEKGLSTWFIEKAIGMSRSNLISVEKGRRNVSDRVLMKLASIPEMGVDYPTLKSWQLEDKFGVGLASSAAGDWRPIIELPEEPEEHEVQEVFALMLIRPKHGPSSWLREPLYYDPEGVTWRNHEDDPVNIDHYHYFVPIILPPLPPKP